MSLETINTQQYHVALLEQQLDQKDAQIALLKEFINQLKDVIASLTSK